MRGEELIIGQNANEDGEPNGVWHKRGSPVDAFHMPALATNINNM
jgi:hypothetical protein